MDRTEDRLEQGEVRVAQNEARLERSGTRQEGFEAKMNAVIDILEGIRQTLVRLQEGRDTSS
jgi:hypothetical protein